MSSLGQGPPDRARGEGDGPILVIPRRSKPSRWEIWKGRISLIIFVLFCLEIGIVLTVLPWTTVWSTNSLLAPFPQLKVFLLSNFVRGLIAGLGLINIWMGISEAVRYRESPD